MGAFAPIRDYVDTLVHPSALADALTAARHRAFIAPRLVGGVVALASFPLYLIVRRTPSAIELVAFAWFLAPILTAFFLSRTGRYESAHALSSLSLTALLTMIAATSGGIGSFAASWLIIVPFEAVLSASRRVVAIASISALAAAALLVLLGEARLLPAVSSVVQAPLAALGIVSAALYAAGLALAAEELTRTGRGQIDVEGERYRLITRNMKDVIMRHARDGSVLFASPTAKAMFGTAVGGLKGQGLFERVHVADRPAFLTALGDAAALAETRTVEFRVRRDGAAGEGANVQFVWIEMCCRPLPPAPAEGGDAQDGEIVAVLRDVSDRKRQLATLEDARTASERADARNGRFLAIMSHELRTPLNAIIGFSDMLMKERSLLLEAERRHEYASLINESGHHLLSVVNGVLDMSKIDTDNFQITAEPFAPAGVVAKCCDLVAPRAHEAGVRLDNTVTADLPEMNADRRALHQILLNLLSNAIRFSDRGGRVVIGARAEAGNIVFTVEDDGIGISEEDLARLGEPYFQGRASHEKRHGGTGLGLSIVNGLVQLHGGEVSIHSRLGQGTRVTVRLPLDCERSRPAERSMASGKVGNAVQILGGACSANPVYRGAHAMAGSASPPQSAAIPVKKSA